MSKVLVDAERLDFLVEIVGLSGYCILKNGKIIDCLGTSCYDCVFNTTPNSCFFGCNCHKGIKDWLKGD